MKFKKSIIVLLGATLLSMSGCSDKKVISDASHNYIHVGANWADLSNLKGDEKYKLTVKSKSNTYKIGEKMSFDILSQKSGFLYILYTNDKDKTTWIYPNNLSNDNNIEKSHRFTIPSADGSWHLQAGAPAGKSLLSFFLFTDDEKAEEFFRNHNSDKSYSKDLVIVAKKNNYGVANVVVEVVE